MMDAVNFLSVRVIVVSSLFSCLSFLNQKLQLARITLFVDISSSRKQVPLFKTGSCSPQINQLIEYPLPWQNARSFSLLLCIYRSHRFSLACFRCYVTIQHQNNLGILYSLSTMRKVEISNTDVSLILFMFSVCRARTGEIQVIRELVPNPL